MDTATLFRALPSTESLLQALATSPQEASYTGPSPHNLPRPFVKEMVNSFLDELRQCIKKKQITSPAELEVDALLPRLLAYVAWHGQPHFRRVLNATGVVIHTNLGRSVLADEAVTAVQEACASYSNLEFDLETGKRGSRYSHVEQLLCRLTGAESALVVNNNAAAVFIVLDTLCKGKEVIVSRGELVEIGGSFRIPEVMEKSGCLLKEVGATNRTHTKDYRQAVSEFTGAFMKVHTSNYRIIGFTHAIERQELTALGAEYGLPVIEDLGSGSLCSFQSLGFPALYNEPTVQEAVSSGMDVITFSGDKVLGGPQAGIIVGKKAWIEKIKQNPLNRALRIDKMTLAALEATLRLYLDPALALSKVPTLRMVFAPQAELRKRATKLARILRTRLGDTVPITTIDGVSRVGGGSFPECDLPTSLVALDLPDPQVVRDKLLRTSPPLVGRIEHDSFCLDPRTLADSEFILVAKALQQALA